MARKILSIRGGEQMTLQRILPFSKTLLRSVVNEGDIAIDATVGNGHDTVFLAEQVGKTGKVFGFDIQLAAIENTKKRLSEKNLLEQVQLFHTSHANIIQTIPKDVHGKVKAAVFNLGYLPGGDKSIVTKAPTTITAIEQLLTILKVGGLIVIVIYHGHNEGKRERDEVLAYVKQIEQTKADVLRYEFINQKNHPPFIIAIQKK